jgi:hypothetical protein
VTNEDSEVVLYRIQCTQPKHSHKILSKLILTNQVCWQHAKKKLRNKPEHTCSLYVILDKEPVNMALHCKAFPLMLTKLSF